MNFFILRIGIIIRPAAPTVIIRSRVLTLTISVAESMAYIALRGISIVVAVKCLMARLIAAVAHSVILARADVASLTASTSVVSALISVA